MLDEQQERVFRAAAERACFCYIKEVTNEKVSCTCVGAGPEHFHADSLRWQHVALTAASNAEGSGSTASASGDYAGQTLKVAAIETATAPRWGEKVAAVFEEKTGATVELTMDKNLEDVIDPQMKAGEFLAMSFI